LSWRASQAHPPNVSARNSTIVARSRTSLTRTPAPR
jgi:hypothetical protein